MKTIAHLLVLALLSILLPNRNLCAQAPNTAGPAGWLGLTWGMTEEEILKSNPEAVRYPKRLELVTGELAVLHIPRLNLGGLAFHIFFGLSSPDGKLVQISAQPNRQDQSDTAYKLLKDLLVKEFGPPRFDGESDGEHATVWLLPTSVARLTRARMRMSEFDLPVPDLFRTEVTIRANGASPHLPFGARWCMTPNEVRKLSPAIESADTAGSEVVLTAVAELDDQKAKLLYTFADDKLWRVEYRFRTDHPDRNDFIKDFENMKDFLIEKHGQPATSDTRWRNQLFQNDPKSWGLAISRGDLTYTSIWRTAESEITLKLSGETLKVNLVLTFKSRALGLALDEKPPVKAPTDAKDAPQLG